MTNEKDNIKEMKESAQFYKEEKIKAHVVLQNKNTFQTVGPDDILQPIRAERFYNGDVIDIKENILIINDLKLGAIAVPISEIFRIERFKEGNGNNIPKSFYQA